MALLVKIGADLKNFDSAMTSLNRRMNSQLKTIENVGKALTASVTLPLSAIGAVSVKVATDFDSSMRKVQAVTGATSSEFNELAAKAEDMAANTTKNTQEVAEAMYYMGTAGWDATQIMSGLEGVIRLSEAAGTDLATTSDILTDALTAFGMSAEESSKFADLLASTSSNANTNVDLLGESFKYVAPLFGAMGYNAEDCAMALGLMANAGVKGSQAGTSLKTAIANMASPTKAMKNAMDDLGISLTDSEGNMLSFKDVMGNLRTAFADLDEAQQASYASTIFGKEAMSGMLAVINASEADFNKLTEATTNYIGKSNEMAETMNAGPGGAMKAFQSKVEAVSKIIGDNLNPAIVSITKVLGGLLDSFRAMSPAMQSAAVAMGAVLATIGPAILVVTSLIKLKRMWADATKMMIVLNGSLTLSLSSLMIWIAAIIAAIAAVVGVITYLWNTNETFRNFIIDCWEAIKEVAITAWGHISEFISDVWESLVELGTNLFNDLKNFFSENSDEVLTALSNAWNTIKSILGAVWDGIKTVATFVFDALKKFFNENSESIRIIFDTIWNAILFVLETTWTVISSLATSVFNKLTNFWSRWGDTIKNVFSSLWEGVKGVFSAALSILTGIFNVFAGLFTGNWSKVWEGVKGIFVGIWNGIKSVFSSGINGLISLINGFIKGINKIQLPDFIPGIGGKGINIPLIPQVALAKGGIVTRPTVALTGEAGPEAVIPLKKLHDFIPEQKVVNNEQQQQTPISVTVQSLLDGKVVAETTTPFMDTITGNRLNLTKRGLLI